MMDVSHLEDAPSNSPSGNVFSRNRVIPHTNAAYSQTGQFEFTAQREFGFGPDFGESLSGVLTIDYGAQADQVSTSPQTCGEEAFWFSGLFAVDVVTESGYVSGTTVDSGNLTAASFDHLCQTPTSSDSVHFIENIFDDNGAVKITRFENFDQRAAGDGVADWLEFDPAGDISSDSEFSIVVLSSQNFQTGEFSTWFYRVDSFRAIVTNIVIDGVDTEIADFDYNGTLVSELIQDAADNAKNHAKFVSEIAKLTKSLNKAGLLTKEERQLILNIAAQSSIGK